ncbi:unnamed protein product [Medioppia subpectinata]|uniref:rRNA-processing protein UTP23 homolog n=1 Tax=Medioppia subpectinata TaxID=1979941 RepID=A0A7R9Q2A3_9ACAR|nr:unnamed protein product [Medioppia subpectinata]CAG2109918.1 unnamed protein product [Medioppia subpectinata]
MKVKRYKRVQKYIQFYKNSCGFRAPYQVLIDATFCQFCLNNKVNITEQIPKYLSQECKLLTTVCVVQEAQRLSQSLYGAMLIIKQFPIRRCGHEKSPIDASECLRELICADNNSDHYMLCTQDLVLTRAIRRSTVGCPLIYMRGNAMVMQKPHDTVREAVERREQEASDEHVDHQMDVLKKLKRAHDLDDDDSEAKPRPKRKRTKGPNPLSCKKKTKKPMAGQQSTAPKTSAGSSGGDQRSANKKRRRNRGGKHIRQMFDKISATVSGDK